MWTHLPPNFSELAPRVKPPLLKQTMRILFSLTGGGQIKYCFIEYTSFATFIIIEVHDVSYYHLTYPLH